ncbi:MICOS complex subunit Mic19-like [Asterias rubens]|uniref:MICOS complex subunit Mic19-like n=1 Tax=Asterias rubens TaxID=7604 RepID=UPI00145585AE|nr:MICOS complex subunit Mic19-like [Asterias rubens]XP_033647123.1 MICOS complex subunit Mic19-like [Asterias rubens]
MGSSSSTRTITVEQDAETGVVKVSEDLLKRMLGGGEDRKEQAIPDKQPEREGRHHPVETSSYDLKRLNEDWQERLYQTEQQWQLKLDQAEEKNTALLQLTNDQFKQAAEEVEAKFVKHQYVPICQKLQDEVLKCYAANPGRALNCSQEVKAFTTCVEHSRTSILTKKGQETLS